jgi:hypothetical protein
VPYSIAVSKLRRPFLSDRYFFIAVRLLKRREKLTEPDFALLARAFNRARALYPFYLTAWVFLPDPSAHCICALAHPTTNSLAMKSVARTPFPVVSCSSIENAADHRSGGPGYQFDERGQPAPGRRGGTVAAPVLRPRPAHRQGIHTTRRSSISTNPVKAGLVSRPEDWRWSSYNEYAGMSAEEQKQRCGLIVDRVRMPSDPRAQI